MIRRSVVFGSKLKNLTQCSIEICRNADCVGPNTCLRPGLSSWTQTSKHTLKCGYVSKVMVWRSEQARWTSTVPSENKNKTPIASECVEPARLNSTSVTSSNAPSMDAPLQRQRLIEHFLSKCPQSVHPYIKLMRIDRPIGSWLLFWPCGWSIAMSAEASSLPSIEMLTLFAFGAFIMRGAGCTINDLWDRDIDKMVARTKDRPLVSGSISSFDAMVFLMGQLGVGLLVLLQLNAYCVVLGASSLGLVITYPLMKRITYWPQLILGLTFNWGAMLGWAAVHGSVNWAVCLPLYFAGTCWTIFYDTIYAHQDKVDDVLLGIKSTAIKFGEHTKLWLSGFGGSMIGGLLVSGAQCGIGWPYYVSVAVVASHLSTQIFRLNIDNPQDCAQKFLSNQQVGFVLFLGIVLGMLFKSTNNDHHKPSEMVVTTMK